jgi:hypothetical protein
VALGSRSGTFKSTGEAVTEAGAGTETAGEVPGEDATTATATDSPTPVAPLTEFKPELNNFDLTETRVLSISLEISSKLWPFKELAQALF